MSKCCCCEPSGGGMGAGLILAIAAVLFGAAQISLVQTVVTVLTVALPAAGITLVAVVVFAISTLNRERRSQAPVPERPALPPGRDHQELVRLLEATPTELQEAGS